MLQSIFLLISLLSLFFLFYGTGKNKRLVILFLCWQLIIGILAFNQVFLNNPILFPIVILGTIVLTVYALYIIDTKKINSNYLLSNHILRIPVELVLYQLFLQQKLPKLMTFEGWNFDIFIGITALLILIYQLATKRKFKQKFMLFWNGIGMGFLLIIISLAILSSPLPIQQFAFDQPNIAVLEFPYCFLPACIVPIVLISHILMLNKATSI